MATSGFDAVVLDVQHGAAGVGSSAAIECLRRCALSGCVPLARAPPGPSFQAGNRVDAAAIGALLDAGARGIIAPLIESAEDASALVAACRYPAELGGEGKRSWGAYASLSRGENDRGGALAIAMIETAVAIDKNQLEAIASTPGLDGIFIGTVDLALALGRPANAVSRKDRLLLTAMDNVYDAVRQNGLQVGLFSPVDMAALFAKPERSDSLGGYDFVAPGADILYLRAAASAAAAQVTGKNVSP